MPRKSLTEELERVCKEFKITKIDGFFYNDPAKVEMFNKDRDTAIGSGIDEPDPGEYDIYFDSYATDNPESGGWWESRC